MTPQEYAEKAIRAWDHTNLKSAISEIVSEAIAAAAQAEREACEWHIKNAIKFYEERITWCDQHPGNDAAKITSQCALESHAGVLAAIRARSEAKS